MEILSVGLWIIIIPVRFVYFICLFGVTIEDILWFGEEHENESKHHSTVKLSRIVLFIACNMWLWSHMGVGLVCLLICSIAYSIRDTELSRGHDDERESKKRERYWNIFQIVRCVLRYVVGIMWLWSHNKELVLLYVSPFAVVVICVIVTRLREVGSGEDHTGVVQENSVNNPQNSTQGWIEKPINFICLVIVLSFLFYKTIIYLSKIIWRSMSCQRVSSESAPEISIHSSTSTPSRDSSTSPRSNDNTTRSSWKAMIGQNVNVSGTQTIGRVTIGDYNVVIKINGGRDIIFNTYYER